MSKEDEDLELDTILKLFDEKRTTKVFNTVDMALSKVITDLKPTPYEVEVALKLIDLKLRDLETRSAMAGLAETEYQPTEENENSKGMFK